MCRPWRVIALWLVLTAGAALGGARIAVDTSTDSVLDRRGEDWAVYQRSLDLFGADEMLVVALKDSQPFAPRVLQEVLELSRSLQAIEGVRRVDSLATVPAIRLDQNGQIDLTPAVVAPRDSDWSRVSDEVARVVANDRISLGSLISRDGRVAAINVLLDRAQGSSFERVVTDVREQTPSGSWISGVPVFRTEINTRTGSEIAFFAAMTVILVAVLLVLAFGSFTAVFHALALGLVGSAIVIGSMGWTGTPLTLSTMILPSVMLALGCAYAMHSVSVAIQSADDDRLSERLQTLANPLALSGLTTTIGFVAISATRIEALREVGGFGALGVLALCLASLSLTPALLKLVPVRDASSGNARRRLARIGERASRSLLNVARKRWRAVVVLTVVFSGLLSVGLNHLIVETDATRWFRTGTAVRDDYELIREWLSGISPMNVIVDGGGARVTEPALLRAIDGLAAYLEHRMDVGKAISVADPLRQLNGALLRASDQALPASEAVAEQYLLLLSGMKRMEDLVSPDHLRANILLRVNNNGSEHLLDIAAAAEEWWRGNGPSGASARATGIMYEFARAQEEISFGQIKGLGLAFACVALILMAAYRSMAVTVLALIPNALPIAAAYGAMGLFGVPLDAGTVLVGSVALGIAIDDTVHVVDGFVRESREGFGVLAALERTFSRVLIPLMLTTMIVGAGFAVLGFSEFTFTRNLGVLTASILALCFVADVVLLPAMLYGREQVGRKLFGLSP